jgi:hypothetical protein
VRTSGRLTAWDEVEAWRPFSVGTGKRDAYGGCPEHRIRSLRLWTGWFGTANTCGGLPLEYRRQQDQKTVEESQRQEKERDTYGTYDQRKEQVSVQSSVLPAAFRQGSLQIWSADVLALKRYQEPTPACSHVS